jgi:predicted NBD/HSP70 family sugar kinase
VRRARERLNRDNTSSLSRLAMQDSFTAADLALEANNGDDFSIMMLERTGRAIGIAVASMINLLSIERIILGGAVMEAGDMLLKPIVHEARQRSLRECFEATEIVASELGADAAAIGARCWPATGPRLIQRRSANLSFLLGAKLAQFLFQFRAAVGQNRNRQQRRIRRAGFSNR